ncbi:MAG: DNA repair protein RecO [Candidatus Saccharibacteria bacterium]|nr:DNA repair protein RecO [Candidatus Saccharibacteria bacterium]
MSSNIPNHDFRTSGFVLRRTNYGEADRILNLITPMGKISAMAKGVRKEKSKLAGGVEMFTLTDFNIHQGKSDLAVITGAKMVKHYGGILKDFTKLELAGMVLKKINLAADSSDNPEYFEISKQCLAGLDKGINNGLVEGWFLMNLLKAMGEDINLYRDIDGERLDAGRRYDWSVADEGFCRRDGGLYGAEEIKMLRLMYSTDLNVVSRVKMVDEVVSKVLPLVRVFAKA